MLNRNHIHRNENFLKLKQLRRQLLQLRMLRRDEGGWQWLKMEEEVTMRPLGRQLLYNLMIKTFSINHEDRNDTEKTQIAMQPWTFNVYKLLWPDIQIKLFKVENLAQKFFWKVLRKILCFVVQVFAIFVLLNNRKSFTILFPSLK